MSQINIHNDFVTRDVIILIKTIASNSTARDFNLANNQPTQSHGSMSMQRPILLHTPSPLLNPVTPTRAGMTQCTEVGLYIRRSLIAVVAPKPTTWLNIILFPLQSICIILVECLYVYNKDKIIK